MTKDVAACEEFFNLIVEAHILSAAMTTFGMKSIDEEPQNATYFPPGSCALDSIQRNKILLLACDKIVSRYINLDYCNAKKQSKTSDPNHDSIHAYACEVLSLGMLVMKFQDAIREGDGDRMDAQIIQLRHLIF